MEFENIGTKSCEEVVAQFKNVEKDHQLLAVLQLLQSAASEGRLDVFNWVLDQGIIAEDESFVLEISSAAAVAIENSHPPIIESIVERYPELQGETLLSGILALQKVQSIDDTKKVSSTRRSLVWLKSQLEPSRLSEVREIAQQYNYEDSLDWFEKISISEEHLFEGLSYTFAESRTVLRHFSQFGIESTRLPLVFKKLAGIGRITAFRHLVEKCGKRVDYQAYGVELLNESIHSINRTGLTEYLLENGLYEMDLTANDHQFLRLRPYNGARYVYGIDGSGYQKFELIEKCLEIGSDVMLPVRKNLLKLIRKSNKQEFLIPKKSRFNFWFDKYSQNPVTRTALELGFDGTLSDLDKLISNPEVATGRTRRL